VRATASAATHAAGVSAGRFSARPCSATERSSSAHTAPKVDAVPTAVGSVTLSPWLKVARADTAVASTRWQLPKRGAAPSGSRPG